MYEVVFYEDEKGNCPVDEFRQGLQVKVRAKVDRWLERLEHEGPNLPRPYADVLRGKIRELRVNFSPHAYRLFYFFYKNKVIVITHAISKKTNKVPVNEIERAERIMDDYIKHNK